MSRVASHSFQADEGVAVSDLGANDVEIHQPMDPFEDIPRGDTTEEVGFGSLGFEDHVIVHRGPDARRPRAKSIMGSPNRLSGLRIARAFANH